MQLLESILKNINQKNFQKHIYDGVIFVHKL